MRALHDALRLRADGRDGRQLPAGRWPQDADVADVVNRLPSPRWGEGLGAAGEFCRKQSGSRKRAPHPQPLSPAGRGEERPLTPNPSPQRGEGRKAPPPPACCSPWPAKRCASGGTCTDRRSRLPLSLLAGRASRPAPADRADGPRQPEPSATALDWLLATPVIDGVAYRPAHVVLAGFSGISAATPSRRRPDPGRRDR